MEFDRIGDYVEIMVTGNRIFGHLNLNGFKCTRSVRIRLAGFSRLVAPVKRENAINSIKIDIIKEYLRDAYIPSKRESDSWPPDVEQTAKLRAGGSGSTKPDTKSARKNEGREGASNDVGSSRSNSGPVNRGSNDSGQE